MIYIKYIDLFNQLYFLKNPIEIGIYIILEGNVLFNDATHYFRNALTRFRLAYTIITTHRNRYRHDLPRQCHYCDDLFEDEFHFLFIWPLYTDLRLQYLSPKYRRHPSRLKMIILLTTEWHTQKWNLSKYICEALRIREVFCNS